MSKTPAHDELPQTVLVPANLSEGVPDMMIHDVVQRNAKSCLIVTSHLLFASYTAAIRRLVGDNESIAELDSEHSKGLPDARWLLTTYHRLPKQINELTRRGVDTIIFEGTTYRATGEEDVRKLRALTHGASKVYLRSGTHQDLARKLNLIADTSPQPPRRLRGPSF